MFPASRAKLMPVQRTLILASLMVCLGGCEAINNEKEVYGSYELTSRDGKILLEGVADHSYSETIRFPNGSEQKNSGQWHWRDEPVCLNAFLVARSAVNILSGHKPK